MTICAAVLAAVICATARPSAPAQAALAVSAASVAPRPIIFLDAAALRPGRLEAWSNEGTAGGAFRPMGAGRPSVAVKAGRRAVVFAGKGDALRSDFPVPPALAGRHPFTVEAIVLDPASATKKTIVSWASGTRASAEVGIGSGRNAAFFSSHRAKTGYEGGVPTPGRWHRLAVSYDGSRIRVYVDGELNAVRAAALSVRPGPAVLVGAGWNAARRAAFQQLEGSLARLAVFDRALSPDEIWALAGRSGPAPAEILPDGPVPPPPAADAASARARAAALRSNDPDEIVFFVVSDLHYGASVAADDANAAVVDAMNRLPGERFPAALGGGVVPAPRGVVVLGDIVDDGEADDAAEVWAAYAADYGINGEGRLAFPVYDGYGNHDGGPGGVVRRALASRRRSLPGLVGTSPGGDHYAWDWGRLHAVHLNLFPGMDGDDMVNPWGGRFQGDWKSPRRSLEFLTSDLGSTKGEAERPVILFQHYGWDEWGRGWWSDRERAALAELLRGRRVDAVFWGHSHAVQRIDWQGIPTWCVGSANKDPEPGEFVVVRWRPSEIGVAVRRNGRWERAETVRLRRPGRP